MSQVDSLFRSLFFVQFSKKWQKQSLKQSNIKQQIFKNPG